MITQEIVDETRIVLNPGAALDNDNAHEMADALSGARERGYRFIVIDMSALQFLSSAGIGSILGYVEMQRDDGGDIVLMNPSEKILHILEVLDLHEYLTVRGNNREKVS